MLGRFLGAFGSADEKMKICLKKVISNAKLLYTELLKTLFEVEHVLNDKTLCYSCHDEVAEVLTPNCLLYGLRLSSANENICERDAADVDEKDLWEQKSTI